jgi:hypothetical protein
MIIKLPVKWKMVLSDLPETSMGAQHVDITFRDGRVIRDVSVFNGEACETKEPFDVTQISHIKLAEK